MWLPPVTNFFYLLTQLITLEHITFVITCSSDNVQERNEMLDDVTWRDVTWRDVTWRDVTWRDVTWRDVNDPLTQAVSSFRGLVVHGTDISSASSFSSRTSSPSGERVWCNRRNTLKCRTFGDVFKCVFVIVFAFTLYRSWSKYLHFYETGNVFTFQRPIQMHLDTQTNVSWPGYNYYNRLRNILIS